jgi:ketosteroid isomerase-like protein
MSESPATVVRRFFERYEQAGVEGALEVISPDAVLVVPPEVSSEPDVYEGLEGGRRYFAGFEGALDDVRFDYSTSRSPSPAWSWPS